MENQLLSNTPPDDIADEEDELAILEAERLTELGQIEVYEAKYDEALRCFQGALKLVESRRSRVGKSKVLLNLAQL
jgi:hypothetical protein